MAYLIPGYILSELDQIDSRRTLQQNIQESMNLDHKCLLVNDENDFWSNLLNEVIAEHKKYNANNIEYAIFKKVNLHLKNKSINFFVAFKYFWNLLFYYQQNCPSEGIREIKLVHISLERYNFSVNTNDIIIPGFLTKVPLILVPNLVGFLFIKAASGDGFSRCEDLARNKFQILREFPFPRFKELSSVSKDTATKKKKLKGNKTLKKEYSEREKDGDFVTPDVIISLLKELKPKNKKNVMELIRTMTC